MPQVTAGCLDPFPVFRENKYARFFPPHRYGQYQRYGKNHSHNVMNGGQSFQTAENETQKVQFFVHNPQAGVAKRQAGDGQRPVHKSFIF
jgi:hypothetical protein